MPMVKVFQKTKSKPSNGFKEPLIRVSQKANTTLE